VELVARYFHILNTLSGIKGGQLQSKPTGMLGLNTRLRAGFKIPPEPLMPK